MSRHHITLTVNGARHDIAVTADRFLVDVLRDDLGLTGTKQGCDAGVCGACSVIVDGLLLSACLVLAVTIDNATIETVEGLAAADGTLSPLQDAFIREGGFQCGWCTPGQLMAAEAWLRLDAATRPPIREWMRANLCRCTGYQGIVDAVCVAAGAGRPR